MTTATHRVASLHLAKIQKEAQIKKKMADLLYEPVAKKLTTAMAAHETIISKKSKAGWSWIGKSQNPSNIVKMLKSGGQPFNLNDPLQKLIHESIKSKKPLDQVDILGRFNLAFAKKDTSGMADALSIEEEPPSHSPALVHTKRGYFKRANNYSREADGHRPSRRTYDLLKGYCYLPRKGTKDCGTLANRRVCYRVADQARPWRSSYCQTIKWLGGQLLLLKDGQ